MEFYQRLGKKLDTFTFKLCLALTVFGVLVVLVLNHAIQPEEIDPYKYQFTWQLATTAEGDTVGLYWHYDKELKQNVMKVIPLNKLRKNTIGFLETYIERSKDGDTSNGRGANRLPDSVRR